MRFHLCYYASASQVATKSTEMPMTPSVICEPRYVKTFCGSATARRNSEQESRNQTADVMFQEIRLLIEVEQNEDTVESAARTGSTFFRFR